MHIILGLLGVIVTILVLLNRLQENGLDIGWLNPFSWHRRRKYRINHDLNPVFKLESPMDVAAVYMLAVAKVDGDLTQEQKTKILSLFQSEFHLNQKESEDLLGSSAHLLFQDDGVFSTPSRVMNRCYYKITSEQCESINAMVDKMALGNAPSTKRDVLVAKIKGTCVK